MKLCIILGTRPQVIKTAPLIIAARKTNITLSIIHTGQHYDYEMSRVFFDAFKLPQPDVNLDVASGSHASQTGNTMIKCEEALKRISPDLALVPGDTNSALAGGLAAIKLGIPVAHLESGGRSYDLSMPEEVNRRTVDHFSRILFAPTENCKRNLLKEDIDEQWIFKTGDTMLDAVLLIQREVDNSSQLEGLNLDPGEYFLLTSHRPENVDSKSNLSRLIRIMSALEGNTTIFPVHPRTRASLRKHGLMRRVRKLEHIRLVEPVDYASSLSLIKDAKAVLTDSGGMQKEALWLGVPCVTLRENTEWIETLRMGGNVLTGLNEKKVKAALKGIESRRIDVKKARQLFGGGGASERTVQSLSSISSQDLLLT